MKYFRDSVVPAIHMTEREHTHDSLGQHRELCPFTHVPRTRVSVSPSSLQKELRSSFLDMPSKQHYYPFL